MAPNLTSVPDASIATDADEEMIHDSPDWTRGDFTLISSDGCRYRVRAVTLCWASEVLSDAIEGCSSDSKREIRFTDPEIESSAALALFLSFVNLGTLAGWRDDFASCNALCAAVAFMHKYDCACPLQFLRIHITNLLHQRAIAPLFAFMVAAAMDDVALSVTAFERRFPVPAGAELPGSAAEAGRAILSLEPAEGVDGAWPFQVWARTRAEFLWAAQTAWARVANRKTAVFTLNTARTAATPQPHQRRDYERGGYSSTAANPVEKLEVCELDIAQEYRAAIRTVKGGKSEA